MLILTSVLTACKIRTHFHWKQSCLPGASGGRDTAPLISTTSCRGDGRWALPLPAPRTPSGALSCTWAPFALELRAFQMVSGNVGPVRLMRKEQRRTPEVRGASGQCPAAGLESTRPPWEVPPGSCASPCMSDTSPSILFTHSERWSSPGGRQVQQAQFLKDGVRWGQVGDPGSHRTLLQSPHDQQCPAGGTPSRSWEGLKDADQSTEMRPAEALTC